MTQEIFSAATTGSVTLTGMDSHECFVFVGGDFNGATVKVSIKPRNGLQFYVTHNITTEDSYTIRVPKMAELKIEIVGTATSINAEIVSAI